MTMDTDNSEIQPPADAPASTDSPTPTASTPSQDDGAPTDVTPSDTASAESVPTDDVSTSEAPSSPTAGEASDASQPEAEAPPAPAPAPTRSATAVSQSLEVDKAASAAALLFEDTTDAATSTPEPVNLFTEPAGAEETERRNAAEREYQAAMRAVQALGLDQEKPAAGVDQETAAAQRLVDELGLGTTKPTPDKPAAPVEFGTETAADERARRQTEERVRREEEEEILGPEATDNRAWYVINTYSGHENRVKANLTRRIASMDVAERIFRVEVPTEEELEIRGGQRRQVQRKLLPGYVLAEMILDDDTWYVVRNTPGVTGFVGAEKPHALPRSEVLGILKQMREEVPRLRVGFEVDDMVRVREGPFEDFMGQVDEINLDKGKVRVMISMFGRDTPVELDFMQVEKA